MLRTMVSPEHSLPSEAVLAEYAKALGIAANRKADSFSKELVPVLQQADIPIKEIMVTAYHQAGFNRAEFVVIYEGEEFSLARQIHQASVGLLAKEENREMFLFPLSSTSPGALEPDHYFPGYRTVFPPPTT